MADVTRHFHQKNCYKISKTHKISSFNKIHVLHTSRRLVSFTMMFSKETLSSFTNQYIAARKGNSCVPVFASSAALPETLKEPIVLFLRQYYLDGLRFMYDSIALTPATITSHGGSLLVKYINSLRTHAVLLAPMCQEILQDDELKKNFLAEAPNGHSVRERAWEMQQKNINSFVKNYVMENIVDRLTQGKLVSSLIRYWSTK
jgi:hypothetical protein